MREIRKKESESQIEPVAEPKDEKVWWYCKLVRGDVYKIHGHKTYHNGVIEKIDNEEKEYLEQMAVDKINTFDSNKQVADVDWKCKFDFSETEDFPDNKRRFSEDDRPVIRRRKRQ